MYEFTQRCSMKLNPSVKIKVLFCDLVEKSFANMRKKCKHPGYFGDKLLSPNAALFSWETIRRLYAMNLGDNCSTSIPVLTSLTRRLYTCPCFYMRSTGLSPSLIRATSTFCLTFSSSDEVFYR